MVVLEHKIYVYNFSDLKIVHQTDTWGNPHGICSLSPTQESCVMACPGLIRGQVRVELYEPQNVTKFIQAHDSPLRCVVLSLDGSLVATASEKGTLVRVFDCQSGCLLHEFRRGTDKSPRKAQRVISSVNSSHALRALLRSHDSSIIILRTLFTLNKAPCVRFEYLSE